MKKVLDWSGYLEKAEETVSEGVVLLKNDNKALPLEKGSEVAVFGRIQSYYYKSGTGSGGMVNVSKVIDIPEGLRDNGVRINKRLSDVYEKWNIENPYEVGDGWAGEPWSQKEMPLDESLVSEISRQCKTAVVIIGRTAGEEQDNLYEEGAYLLSATEKDMLGKVRRYFEKVIILLNVGGIMDMKDMLECSPDAIAYVWQGGMTGGEGTARVLTGKVSPSGKLPDTIAENIEDYPSDKNFGDRVRNFYCEDIYVGYRYFETFAPEKVIYPFGFGLSYTSFDIDAAGECADGENVRITADIRNTGKYPGKEVLQVYVRAPQGKLGKPLRALCGFEKTKTLSPGQSEKLEIVIPLAETASYDDSGATGHKSCFVLEDGDYDFFAGTDVRSAKKVFTYHIGSTVVTKKLEQAVAPVLPFERIKPAAGKDGGYIAETESVPLLEISESERIKKDLPRDIAYTGDRGIKLSDVVSGKNSMDEFIAQLSDYDLSCIIRGEGMGSPKVTPGTASAFGGVTESLGRFGIPCGCCSDGPSGMRLDCGTKAFSLPNGTMIASTFNKDLVRELFEFTGTEMALNKVDCLLGPGMNIHRHPLNGRNFEYFSEDPLVTGEMATAILNGLHSSGVTGTLKHFCGNNQETQRRKIDSVISERALREIYLRGFEIAVKKGNADSIMTTYGSLNGLWTAGNYDLVTTVLRKEWGFTGFVMTDWWAEINERGKPSCATDFSSMARAQNDVYMVCADSSDNNDNTLESLENGSLTRGQLQRNAANICGFLTHTNAFRRLTGQDDTVEVINRDEEEDGNDGPVVFHELNQELTLPLDGICTDKGKSYSFAMTVNDPGMFRVTVTASSEQSEVAQIPVTLITMGTPSAVFTWKGTGGKPVSFSKEIPLYSHFTAARLFFAQSGLKMISIKFERSPEQKGRRFGEI